MGTIKEYIDRETQTEADPIPSPYADPAVVLAAPCRGVAHAGHVGYHDTISASSPAGSDGACAAPPSPTSPMLAPLVSRRLSRRRHARCPAGEITNRRIVSMPESKSEIAPHSRGKRVVSMPDRLRPVLEPSVELVQSPTVAGDSFGSYDGRRERVRVFRAPSDVPQTPSPPSSPESLLIIASGTQLPEGFLRRKYSPEPLIEEDEDWIAWATSPPRPIPALHGPLSLPYARCPSGAEGTIIEEPDSVAQMIWGLDPGDQRHNQVRAEGVSAPTENRQSVPSHGPSQVPSRLQKKSTSAAQQASKSSRGQASHANKQNLTRPQRRDHDEKCSQLTQILPDIETRQDIVSEPPWNERQSMPMTVGVRDNLVNDTDVLPIDDNGVLEWQLARLRQALRTPLADMNPYAAYPGRLEPVISAAVAPGLPQPYPRIFVESRPNEWVGSATTQSPIEIAQQHRHQQLYRQTLQKQKMQMQNLLPTPPNSSSPQWSPHFSPYLTYCSTSSPEFVGSTEHPPAVPASSQKYRSGASTSQHRRHVYDRYERDHANNFDTSANILSTKTSRIVSNVNSTPSPNQTSSSSNTLAKYIKQLQALSPIAQFSPFQPVPSSSASLPPLPSTYESASSYRTAYNSPVIPTPPSPESPQTLSRGSPYSTRPMSSIRPVQRRLSSVPEEDSSLLELSASIPLPRLQNHVAANNIPSSQHRTMEHRLRHADIIRKSVVPDLLEFESDVEAPPIPLHHETSPAKVRLPVTKEQNIREQTSGHPEQNKEGPQHGNKKKHRYKKLKGLATLNEQPATRGLVG